MSLEVLGETLLWSKLKQFLCNFLVALPHCDVQGEISFESVLAKLIKVRELLRKQVLNDLRLLLMDSCTEASSTLAVSGL